MSTTRSLAMYRSVLRPLQTCTCRYAQISARYQSTVPLQSAASPATAAPQAISKDSLDPLRHQGPFYAKIHIQDKAYIVTKGDLIHLPVKLKGTSIGDVLNVTAISSFGSRDYTLSTPIPAKPGNEDKAIVGRLDKRTWVGSDTVKCQVTVVEHTKQPMFITIKKKRRNRHAKAIKSKQPYTVLRVSDLQLL